ncbi:hypothetical protein L5515_001492 [Caenorhabditis briggsae]|uniref:Uncharacterized protein n=1 Tax=Caenorhabditis briggsae TaxID=6238 RepID=A0AAE9J3I1_CAEBR|nr:hypothetical protein L3Y34_015415 [Caenorhabditis briggsae]UMM12997.1 hypothetical protein L5515_001492 [Caenorhabditis briggsae]
MERRSTRFTSTNPTRPTSDTRLESSLRFTASSPERMSPSSSQIQFSKHFLLTYNKLLI